MKLSKREAGKIASKLDFEKGKGLVVAIVQEKGKVLMQAFMNRVAFLKTLTTGEMWYYSRSRKRLWRKGETSGNTQSLQSFAIDCDNDSLLFQVKQKGVACHKGTYSCYSREKGKSKFDLEDLIGVILERKRKPKKGSYTCKLLKNEKLIYEKLEEEIFELIEAAQEKGKKNIIWEADDVLYHLLVLMAKKGISLEELCAELARRHK